MTGLVCDPPLFPPLPLPQELRAWDKDAAALGLPEILLMENAARAALHVLRRHCPDLTGKSIWLFMGSGNNGGDAACLARQLLDAHARPLVLHAKALSHCKGACARHVAIARASGVPFFPLRQSRGKWRLPTDNLPDIIVDGIVGTGFSGVLRPQTLTLIETINSLAAQRLVLALDIPSGLNAHTGLPQPEAVRATVTASFAAGKPGLALPCARPWTGRVHVCDIGIPTIVRHQTPCSAYLIDGRCIARLGSSDSLPETSFKNIFGHVLVLGGAPGDGGAAHLASRAALRAGAGLVTAAAPTAAVD
ncbi:NAD(P)H-hydrate epimerase, partial [Desulfovibrio sp. 1188_IL3213]|uniref:NAD(P)H-hydrate epimerase n=1 Tax=Desulfovibrio sp. 1188_IL3213 TaxID=3084052 RepID=UPI002FD8E1B5